jgi:Zn-dependent metalloprotease
MKTKYYLILVLLFLSTITSAQVIIGDEAEKIIPGSESITFDEGFNIPTFVQFREDSKLDFGKFDSWLHKTFKLSADVKLKLLKVENDQIGMTHYRYQETFKGIPLEGTMYIVHLKNNSVVSMNGFLFDKMKSVRTKPGISESSALNKALLYMNAEIYRWQFPEEEKQLKIDMNDLKATWFPKGELFLAPKQGEYKAENYRLAYRFDIFANKPLMRNYIFVDALTGEIILDETRINESNIFDNACTAYSGPQIITADLYSGSNRRLREAGPIRGNGIETYNAQNTTLGGVDFIYSTTNWCSTSTPPFPPVASPLDRYALDAHWGAEKTYDFYKLYFNRNSVDNVGFKLRSFVHFGLNTYFNAAWTGYEMIYGDGVGASTPLTSMEIAGHELSHGVTQHTSDLIYQKEPGALNESFSDCMGIATRYYADGGAGSIDWLIGDEIGAVLRDMANPKSHGQPDTYLRTYWYSTVGCIPTGGNTGNDYCGVHRNSGVMNKWFYLVTSGGSGTNDNGLVYNVTGIGITKAAAITYRMNCQYNCSISQYKDARNNSIHAATDLYGSGSPEVITVIAAWDAVGVTSTYTTIDLWMHDNTVPADIGNEPNNNPGGNMWSSQDIWVSSSPTGLISENPVYHLPITNIHNFVRVAVHNKGSQQSCGKEFLKVYWAKAATSPGYPAPWDGSQLYNGYPLGGNIGIGVQTIPVIAPGGSAILTFQWDPPNPYDYIGAIGSDDPGHFCLLARIETILSPPWGMAFPETSSLWDNTWNNNNVVTKNVEIINSTPHFTSFFMGNSSSISKVKKIQFKSDSTVFLFNKAIIKTKLGAVLYQIWATGGKQGYNVLELGDSSIQLLSPGAYISNLTLGGNSTYPLSIKFQLRTPPLDSLPLLNEYKLDVVQYDQALNNIDGGITFSYRPISTSLNLSVLIEGFWNGTNMISDFATIYLRNATSPYSLRDSANISLDSLGNGNLTFSNVNNGTYYIVVKHRNSIETWSQSPQPFAISAVTNYNFTTAASKAYGNNMKLKGGKYCIYSGDVDQDGLVDITDVVSCFNASNNFLSGYVTTDVNGDNLVDISDIVTCYNNNVNFVGMIRP